MDLRNKIEEILEKHTQIINTDIGNGARDYYAYDGELIDKLLSLIQSENKKMLEGFIDFEQQRLGYADMRGIALLGDGEEYLKLIEEQNEA